MKTMKEEHYIPPQVEVAEVLCEAGYRGSIETDVEVDGWGEGSTIPGDL